MSDNTNNNAELKLYNNGLSTNRTYTFRETNSYFFDKLDQIFEDQKLFTEQIYLPYVEQNFSCYNFSKLDFDIYYTLQRAATEIHEASEHVNSKIWSKKRKEIDRKTLLEELVDASKFIHQAILFLGYNSADYYNMHKTKSQKNRDRQKNGY